MIHARYEVIRRLGEGEAAVAYLAHDISRDRREVVLKLLKTRGIEETRRFRNEFATLVGLRHPNLIGALEFGISVDGAPFLTSEHHPGSKPLSEDLGTPQFETRAIDRVAAILRALEFVHTRGVIHRDLKPANVLVDEADGLWLTDFGLATSGPDGLRAGTPEYMAPEILSRQRFDRRSDLYSLGVLLYELFTGQLPFSGETAEVVRQHLHDAPRPPRELVPELPPALEALVLRLLAKDPDQRFTSANAALGALREATGREIPYETEATQAAYLSTGRLVGRERELDWLVEAFRRAVGPQDWDPDPREFDRRARFDTARANEVEKGERRRGGNRRATNSNGISNPPAVLVFLRGESGVGKTRLVDELRRAAQLEGAVCLTGQCTKHPGRGYEPFVDVLREVAQLGDPSDPNAWVAETLANPDSEGAGVDRLHLMDAVAELLLERSYDRPLLISLEDLQWARGDTLELLLYLFRALVTALGRARGQDRHPQLFLVASYRPEELHGPELGRALNGLKRDRFFEQLSLRPLREDDVGELVRNMLGVPSVPRAFLSQVTQASAGNPLFLELLLEELVERGLIERQRGQWRLREGELGVNLPSLVHELVLSRLERLEAREVLDWLAVFNRALGSSTLSRLTGRDEELVLEELDSLVRSRFVSASPAGGFVLTHAKVRDVVYGALESPGRLHARASELLQEAREEGAAEVPLSELAHHLLEAGEGPTALRRAREAGEAAQAVGAAERAGELYRRALSLCESLASEGRIEDEVAQRERLVLLRALVHVDTEQGRFLEARAQTLEGLEIARKLGDTEAEVSALTHLGTVNARLKEREDARRFYLAALKTAERIDYGQGVRESLLGLGDLTLEEGHLDEALDYLERTLTFQAELGDQAGVAGYLRAIARAYLAEGELQSAIDFAARALELAPQPESAPDAPCTDRVAALELLAELHFLRGDAAQCMDFAERGLQLARRHADKPAIAHCLLALGAAHERLAEVTEARACFDAAAELARRLGLPSALARALDGIGELDRASGACAQALVFLNEATTLWNTQGDRAGYARGLTHLGRCYALHGELPRSELCYAAAERVSWELGHGPARLVAELGRLRVESVRSGATPLREALDKLALQARELSQPAVEAQALALLSEVLLSQGEGHAARRAGEQALRLAADVLPEVRARAARDRVRALLGAGALAPALELLRDTALWRVRDLALAVEVECLRGRALALIGEHAAAEKALTAALAEAEAHDLRLLRVRVLVAQGDQCRRRGEDAAGLSPGEVLHGSPELGRARAAYQTAAQAADEVNASALQRSALLGLARLDTLEGRELGELPGGGKAPAEVLLRAEVELRESAEAALELLGAGARLLPPLKLRWALVRAQACRRAGRVLEGRAAIEDARQAFEQVAAELSAPDRRSLERTAEARALVGDEQLEQGPPPPDDERALAVLRLAAGLEGQRSPEGLGRALVEGALALFGAQRGCLIALDAKGEQHLVSALAAPNTELSVKDRAYPTAIVAQAARRADVVVIEDAGRDASFGDRPSVVDLEVRSVLVAALRGSRGVRHVLLLEDRDSAGRFKQDDRELIALLSSLSAGRLELLALGEEYRAQAEELTLRGAEVERLNSHLTVQVQETTQELDSVRRQLKGREVELGVNSSYANIVGRSEPMRRVFRLLDRVADADVPVLVQGESGTGKELVARAVHFSSQRAEEAYLSINCAALPESLLESELFGHVKGAFTGADRDKVGLFESADGGTLFLDEVGDMPLSMQSKLLRVLQEGEVRPLGGRKPKRINVRIVAASNKDLRQLVDSGEFRADLFYRLNVVSVGLPPLRERKEDLPLLVDHFLEKIAERGGGRRKQIERRVLDHLLHYDWPGNVRELENELRRLVALSGGRIVEADLSPHIQRTGVTGPAPIPQVNVAPAIAALNDGETLKARMEQIEREFLLEALSQYEQNKTRTAKALGLSRYGFLKKLDKYGLRDN